MPAVTVELRVRGIWRLRVVLGLIFLARATGIIRDNDHAVAIAERLTPRLIRVEMRRARRWRLMRLRGH